MEKLQKFHYYLLYVYCSNYLSFRNMFPLGLPNEFSFVSTFRMSSRTRRESWDLLRIEDSFGNPQFGIRVNGRRKELEVYTPDVTNTIQSIPFRRNREIRGVSLYYI